MLSNLQKGNNKTEFVYKNPSQSADFAKYLGVDLNKLPKHIAFIMDGNGR